MGIEKSNREELSIVHLIEQPSAEDAVQDAATKGEEDEKGILESKEESMDSEMPNWFEL